MGDSFCDLSRLNSYDLCNEISVSCIIYQAEKNCLFLNVKDNFDETLYDFSVIGRKSTHVFLVRTSIWSFSLISEEDVNGAPLSVGFNIKFLGRYLF